jgi:hypothetical protein
MLLLFVAILMSSLAYSGPCMLQSLGQRRPLSTWAKPMSSHLDVGPSESLLVPVTQHSATGQHHHAVFPEGHEKSYVVCTASCSLVFCTTVADDGLHLIRISQPHLHMKQATVLLSCEVRICELITVVTSVP